MTKGIVMSRLRGIFIGAGLMLAVFGLTACDNSSTNESSSTDESTTSQNANNQTGTNTESSTSTESTQNEEVVATPPETTTSETSETTTSQASDKIELKLKLQVGQTFRMQTTQSQNLEQSMFGQSVASNSSSTTVMRYDVKSIDTNGNITLTATYESIISREEGPNGVTEFDSSKVDASSQNAQAQIVSAMMGKSLDILMTPQGEVIQVEGFGEMMDAMLATQDPASIELAKPIIESAFGEDAFKDSMQNILLTYPEVRVGVGDLWQSSISVSAGIPMQMNTTWTVTNLENGVLSADVLQTITANPDADPLELGPISLSYPDLVGQGEGQLKIDAETGWVISNRIVHEFTGEMMMEGVDQLGEAPPIPISATIESVIELLE
jgi:cytoskeletal protein RodZ